jgi:[acyl-carrier-protein] S-malonyltransferase
MTYAALFSGQGSHVPGMGQTLIATSAAAREIFSIASDVLAVDMVRVCEDRAGELSDPRLAQPALVTYALAAQAAVGERTGTPPVAAAGHSLGEIAALSAAGAIRTEDAVALASRRGELMAACAPGAMAVVFGLDSSRADEICAQVPGAVVVANVNLSDQCVISGETEAVRQAAERLTASGAVLRPLAITVAAHSPVMAPAVEPFRAALAAIEIRPARFCVVSSVLGRPLGDPPDIIAALSAGLVNRVDWPRTVSALLRATGQVPLVEMGPKAVLRDLTSALATDVTAWSVGADGLALVADLLTGQSPGGQSPGGQSLGGRSPGGRATEAELAACLRVAVGTPALNALDDSGLRALRASFGELRTLFDDSRSGRGAPGAAERGAGLLREIMTAKGHDWAATQAHLAAARRAA